MRAVITGPGPLDAVAPQVDGVVLVHRPGDPPPPSGVEAAVALGPAVHAALRDGDPWCWVVDASARPAPDALAALRGAPLDGLPAPLLLAGRVAGGAPPWPAVLRKEASLAAAREGLLALRAVPAGSLLVHRDAVAAHGPPSGSLLAWTARVLAAAPGYLVGQSTATLAGPAPREPGPLRLLAARHWSLDERLWLVFRWARARRARP